MTMSKTYQKRNSVFLTSNILFLQMCFSIKAKRLAVTYRTANIAIRIFKLKKRMLAKLVPLSTTNNFILYCSPYG